MTGEAEAVASAGAVCAEEARAIERPRRTNTERMEILVYRFDLVKILSEQSDYWWA